MRNPHCNACSLERRSMLHWFQMSRTVPTSRLRLCVSLPPDTPGDAVRAMLANGATAFLQQVSQDGTIVAAADGPSSSPSIHGARVASVSGAFAAERAGADFLLAGDRLPANALHAICASVDIPVVAEIHDEADADDRLASTGVAGVCVSVPPSSPSSLAQLAEAAGRIADSPVQPRRGALVDMDGTVLDSMDVWKALDREMVERHQIPDAEQVLAYLNTVVHIREGTAYLHEHCGIGESEEAVFQECRTILFDHYAHRIPLMPGTREALARLHTEGVRMALVTATEEAFVRAALRRNGVEHLFDSIHCNVSKRRPEALLDVLDGLGTGVRETVVYDDMDSVRAMAEGIGFQTYPGLPTDDAE